MFNLKNIIIITIYLRYFSTEHDKTSEKHAKICKKSFKRMKKSQNIRHFAGFQVISVHFSTIHILVSIPRHNLMNNNFLTEISRINLDNEINFLIN